MSKELWPFVEARRLIERMERKNKSVPLMATGFGPSGLPHLGTYAEVARTSYVRKAYECLTGIRPRLIVFSDDMDALRAVPTNVPNQDMLRNHIGIPLTSIPDPYGEYESFAHHNNAMLRRFLDDSGFDYEFMSSTEVYRSGLFNPTLLNMARNHQAIVDVIAPTLGEERRATWSPFMPIHPSTGKVEMTTILDLDAINGTISWLDANGSSMMTFIENGECKVQWKPDWALRWTALDVDYEMCGKDLRDSVTLSSKICKILGGTPPVNMIYELFLDEDGAKFSKKKGNGVSVDQWKAYAPLASLEHYIFRNPQSAKKVFLDAIPGALEEVIENAKHKEDRSNPAFFVTDRLPLVLHTMQTSVRALLNYVDVVDAKQGDEFVAMLANDAITGNSIIIDDLDAIQLIADNLINYYKDCMSHRKVYRAPTTDERVVLNEIVSVLKNMPSESTSDEIQSEIFEIGKRHYDIKNLRAFFGMVYETIFGYPSGPRLGHFINISGRDKFINLVNNRLGQFENKPEF